MILFFFSIFSSSNLIYINVHIQGRRKIFSSAEYLIWGICDSLLFAWFLLINPHVWLFISSVVHSSIVAMMFSNKLSMSRIASVWKLNSRIWARTTSVFVETTKYSMTYPGMTKGISVFPFVASSIWGLCAFYVTCVVLVHVNQSTQLTFYLSSYSFFNSCYDISK